MQKTNCNIYNRRNDKSIKNIKFNCELFDLDVPLDYKVSFNPVK